MVELQFESTLTMEEIEQNFAGIDFFSGIMDELKEALAYEKSLSSTEPSARKQSIP